MFTTFPKYSVLCIDILKIDNDHILAYGINKKEIYEFRISALIPTAVGDIASKNKNYIFVLDREENKICGDTLTLMEKIFKPLSRVKHDSVSFLLSNNVDKEKAFQMLKSLGFNFPKNVNNLSSFKKYLNKKHLKYQHRKLNRMKKDA